MVRKCVFETNSSSCHTVSVQDSGGVYDGYAPDEDGVVRFNAEEFGWSQETFTDVASRLAYAWIYIKDWSAGREDEFMQNFLDVVLEHTGGTSVECVEYGQFYPYGYIDHQSVEGADLHYIMENKEILKNFLFGAGSYIETDNDNH